MVQEAIGSLGRRAKSQNHHLIAAIVGKSTVYDERLK
jgi:hypothetical protein